MSKTIIFLFFSLWVNSFFSQERKDSMIFVQEQAALFSNEYIFYSNQTFFHQFTSDASEYKIGRGTYVDRGKTRILYFKDFDTTQYVKNKFERYSFERNQTRKLKLAKGSFSCKDYHGTVRTKRAKFKLVNREK